MKHVVVGRCELVRACKEGFGNKDERAHCSPLNPAGEVSSCRQDGHIINWSDV